MRVFILSLLAASACSHAIGRSAHREQLVSYSPPRGEFPVYNDYVQGYVRYFDGSGAERLLRYNYPEPLFGVRRLNYANDGQQGAQFLLKQAAGDAGLSAQSYYQIGDTNELAKVREEHFRRWCEQRYQALKAELEKLRAEGLKPSQDMMAQLKPLEQIISGGSTYTAIGGSSPEIQSIRDEHLRIWNEARLRVLQQEASHLRLGQGIQGTQSLETTQQTNIIGETAEQQKAREAHLRLYNEQLALVKKLEQDTIEVHQPALVYGSPQQPPALALKTNEFQASTAISDTPAVIKAREEHLRLVNEAKLRAQSALNYNTNDDGSYKPAYQTGSIYKNEAKTEQAPILKIFPAVQQPAQPIQNIAILQTAQPINQAVQQQQQQEASFLKSQQQPAPVQDTPEVIKAREEHLRLVSEAKLMAAQTQQQEVKSIDTKTNDKINIDDTEKMREAERQREEQRQLEAARLLEAERMREEEKSREQERLREVERQKEEEQRLEAERLRLMEEEAKRKETERLEEEKRMKAEQMQRISMEQGGISAELLGSQLKTQEGSTGYITGVGGINTKGYESGSSTGYITGASSGNGGLITKGYEGGSASSAISGVGGLITKGYESGASTGYITKGYQGGSSSGYITGADVGGIISTTGTGAGSGSGFVLSSQYKNNPYLIRFASQPGTAAYIIGDQQQAIIKTDAPSPNLYYLPAQKEAPLYLKYTQSGLKFPNAVQQLATASLSGGNAEKYASYASSSSSSSSSNSAGNLKVSYGTDQSAALSELEKATRDHFRAHELALEQLRLADAKATYTKDC